MEQAGKKATLPPDVGIDSRVPAGSKGLSERKWRSVDILQHGALSLSGVPPQSVAEGAGCP